MTTTLETSNNSGSDSTGGYDKEKVIQELDIILHKIKVIKESHAKLQTRIKAISNTSYQCERKASLLNGQANSLKNTARNLQNRLDEDDARLDAIGKAALILQSALDITP